MHYNFILHLLIIHFNLEQFLTSLFLIKIYYFYFPSILPFYFYRLLILKLVNYIMDESSAALVIPFNLNCKNVVYKSLYIKYIINYICLWLGMSTNSAVLISLFWENRTNLDHVTLLPLNDSRNANRSECICWSNIASIRLKW